MARRILAGLLFVAGAVWTIGFPKRTDLEPDNVLSFALAIALFGAAVLVLRANRTGVKTAIVSILLLVSLLANAYFVSENRAMGDLLHRLVNAPARSG